MPMSRNKAMELVLKLMAKAKGTNSPEEASTFAARATELMLRYNLEQAEMERLGRVGRAEYHHKIIGMAWDKWKRILAKHVANANFCDAVETQRVANTKIGYDVVIDIIGLPDMVEVVEYLWTYLRREIDRLGHKSWKDLDPELQEGTTEAKWWRAFCEGATVALGERLAIQQEQAMDTATPQGEEVRALVVVKDAELKTAVAQFYPTLEPVPTRATKNDIIATLYGYETGKAMPMHRGIDAPAESRKRA